MSTILIMLLSPGQKCLKVLEGMAMVEAAQGGELLLPLWLHTLVG